MRNYIIILLLLLEINVYGQRLDIQIDYPVPINSLSGIISPNLQYNFGLKKENLLLGLGTSVTWLKSHDNNEVLNYNIDLGLNCKFIITPLINSYPYFNVGFTRFQNSGTHSDGLKTEIGISICPATTRHQLGLHLAYRQYFLDKLNLSETIESTKGTFGMFLVGLHFHF
ncbi:MAG: hypothetical protein ABI723_22150 [Bacteroidia bacterium]